MNQVKEVNYSFELVAFINVYQEFDDQTNKLFEEALILQEGILTELEFRGVSLMLETDRSMY